MPFDYNRKVVWSSSSFEVEVTTIVSSFNLKSYYGYHYGSNLLVAQWDGTGYNYNGDHALVLNVNDLYGTNCPFTNSGGVDSVMLYSV